MVAFASDRDGAPYIYVIKPDGTGLRRIAFGAAPTWSPDGRSIAFHTWRGGPETSYANRTASSGDEIRIIGVDGSNERVLVENSVGFPAWSPDGSRIAFHRDWEIFVVNADGTGETKILASDYLGYTAPDWSPDGQRIALWGSNFDWWIVVANADGSDLRIITPVEERWRRISYGWPAWSPDGSRIAFSAGHGFDDLHSATPDGRDMRHHGHGYQPAWSTDGLRLVFQRGELRGCSIAACPQRIFISDLSGAASLLVPEAVDPANPRYSDYDAAWSRR